MLAAHLEAGHIITVDGKDYAVCTTQTVYSKPSAHYAAHEVIVVHCTLYRPTPGSPHPDWHGQSGTRFFAFNPWDTVQGG